MNLIFQLERYSDKIDIFAIFVLHHVACMSYHDDRRVLVTNYSPLSLASYNIKSVGYMAIQVAHRNSQLAPTYSYGF